MSRVRASGLSVPSEPVAAAIRLARDVAADRGSDPGAMERFLLGYYRFADPADVVQRDPLDLMGAALAHARLAATRGAGTAAVRAYNPVLEQDGWSSPHTAVEVVTEDMPFLYDSVSAELSRQGVHIHSVLHPTLPPPEPQGPPGPPGPVGPPGPARPAESFLHIEVQRQSDSGALQRIEDGIRRVLADVRAAVTDWRAMADRIGSLVHELESSPPPVPPVDVAETAALLRWLLDDNMTLLGYGEYELTRDGEPGEPGPDDEPVPDDQTLLRRRPGTGLGLLRERADRMPVGHRLSDLPPAVRRRLRDPTLLAVTKANTRSTVHRRVFLDYISIKTWDGDGRVRGEHRVLGLFSARAHRQRVTDIPVVRRSVAYVVDRADFSPGSHDAAILEDILESYPREELFWITPDELLQHAIGILRLEERRLVRAFVTQDPFGRFWSVLVFLPRDRYTTDVRVAINRTLLELFGGTSSDFTTRLSDSALARLHFVVHTRPDPVAPDATTPDAGVAAPGVDLDDLDRRLADVTRSWQDELTNALVEQFGEERGNALADRYGPALPAAYREDVPARMAVSDIQRLDSLAGPDDVAMTLYRPVGPMTAERRFKIFRLGPPVSLSWMMPLLTGMGVEVTDERPYHVDLDHKIPEDGHAAVYDFGLRPVVDVDMRTPGVVERFTDAVAAAWSGRATADGLNALVLAAGLSWREAVLVRALLRYLRQGGTRFDPDHLESVLVRNASTTQLITQVFAARFDPDAYAADAERAAAVAALVSRATAAVDSVPTLDEDRILRGLLSLVLATVRTNFYTSGQGGQPPAYLSLKLDPALVPDLPAPRPAHEVFVYSPVMEGVHMRGGLVARGGLRWSDRWDDYRTEVLELFKAQMVKNAVIVPTGAKGAFVVRAPGYEQGRPGLPRVTPDGVRAAYETFVGGLLDVTDTVVVDDGGRRVVGPPRVIRYDGDDPYLVVAADKGTSTYSDAANALAQEYGFWLGDAFASGGAHGYDHKRMGITARGAWESARWHLRSLGRDADSDEITAVGIGDMSGDVFGNGMLLSSHLRLVAAFDHRHVFVDPTPDPAASYAERARLAATATAWSDYDRSVISPGGGVWPRTAKRIDLTPQMRDTLGIPAEAGDAVSAEELVRWVLRAPVEMLWNGGIGTFVKATAESHLDAGDKTNDAVRIDASELRAAVVVEGGNLGLTQRARVEFARGGGRVLTDSVDNAAGVDASDHEVTIKILLDSVVDAGDLTVKQRNALLAGLTDAVAGSVLARCRERVRALAVSTAETVEALPLHARLIEELESSGRLERSLEALPPAAELSRRHTEGGGLTAPELAVVMAYAKNSLTDELLATDLPDEPELDAMVARAFPDPLPARFPAAMRAHPLRREIAATMVANTLVDEAGTTFAFRLREETGASTSDLVTAFLFARTLLDVDSLKLDLQAAEPEPPPEVVVAAALEVRHALVRSARWLLTSGPRPYDLPASLLQCGAAVTQVLAEPMAVLAPGQARRLQDSVDSLTQGGLDASVAWRVAALRLARSALDVCEVARLTGEPVHDAAMLFFRLSESLGLDDLAKRVEALPTDDRWQTLARAALRDDRHVAAISITADAARTTQGGDSAEDRVDRWLAAHGDQVRSTRAILAGLPVGAADVSSLTVALRALRRLPPSGYTETATNLSRQ